MAADSLFEYNLDVTDTEISSYKESIDFLTTLSKSLEDVIAEYKASNSATAGSKSGTEKLETFKADLDTILTNYLNPAVENLEAAQGLAKNIDAMEV